MPSHPVVHFEIGCHDGGQTREFFSSLFGWQISAAEGGMSISTGAADHLTGHISELGDEWGAYVTVYVEVEELETYLSTAEELGGKTLVPPVTLPGQGSFAWLGSPEGHIVGIWKPE